MRRPLRPARLPPARRLDDPADPPHPQRCAAQGRPLAVDRGQPDRAGRAAAGPQARPAAPDGRRGGPDPG
jgi:hypothetical protein